MSLITTYYEPLLCALLKLPNLFLEWLNSPYSATFNLDQFAGSCYTLTTIARRSPPRVVTLWKSATLSIAMLECCMLPWPTSWSFVRFLYLWVDQFEPPRCSWCSIFAFRKYDFFYLPIDFDRKANLGYAFVNLVNEATAKFFLIFVRCFLWIIGLRIRLHWFAFSLMFHVCWFVMLYCMTYLT